MGVDALRILLVDDNEEITDVISFYCESKDIDCQVVNDGREGLERIRNHKFDLILLDLAMPEFSGSDVIQTLKDDGVLEANKVVIFTASSNRSLLEELKKAGIKEVFKKPCSLTDLQALIEKYRPLA